MMSDPKHVGLCDIRIWPKYNGRDVTIVYTVEGKGDHPDDRVDVFAIDMSPSEAIAFAGLLKIAAECEKDDVSLVMQTIVIRQTACVGEIRELIEDYHSEGDRNGAS